MLAAFFAALLVLGLLSTLSLLSVHATSGAFGHPTVGSITITSPTGPTPSAGFMCGYHAAPSVDGTVNSINAYVFAQSGTVHLAAALYTYLGPGVVGTLIANTSAITVGTTPEWQTLNFFFAQSKCDCWNSVLAGVVAGRADVLSL